MDQHLLDQCVRALVDQSYQPSSVKSPPHHNMSVWYKEAGDIMLLVLLSEMIDKVVQHLPIEWSVIQRSLITQNIDSNKPSTIKSKM